MSSGLSVSDAYSDFRSSVPLKRINVDEGEKEKAREVFFFVLVPITDTTRFGWSNSSH